MSENHFLIIKVVKQTLKLVTMVEDVVAKMVCLHVVEAAVEDEVVRGFAAGGVVVKILNLATVLEDVAVKVLHLHVVEDEVAGGVVVEMVKKAVSVVQLMV